MKKSIIALGLGLSLAAGVANAEADLLGFKGPVTLGLNYNLTNYELDNQSFLATAALKRTFENEWNVGLNLAAVNKSSVVEGKTNRTAENYTISASTGKDIDERQSINGVLAWNKDHFTDYFTNSSLSVQYGYKAIQSDTQNLTFGIGPAYVVQTFRGDRADSESFGGIISANYDNQITPNLKFAQALSTSFTGGDVDSIIDSTTSLNYALKNSLTIGLAHITKFIDADNGFEETTTPSTNIVLGYTY